MYCEPGFAISLRLGAFAVNLVAIPPVAPPLKRRPASPNLEFGIRNPEFGICNLKFGIKKLPVGANRNHRIKPRRNGCRHDPRNKSDHGRHPKPQRNVLKAKNHFQTSEWNERQ
jgi:hypothetical protein